MNHRACGPGTYGAMEFESTRPMSAVLYELGVAEWRRGGVVASWTGGVMGVKVDHSVKWETGLEGMKSNKGQSTVLWRAWESWEQNLARGVDPKSMGKSWGGK